MRVRIGFPLAWGRELHPFCGDAFWHIGLLHFHWRMTPREYEYVTGVDRTFWGEDAGSIEEEGS